MAEYDALLKQEVKEREFLKKEMRPDMYIEKILFTKFYRNKQKALDEIGYEKQCSKDRTANQRCQIKVRAIGLDFNVTKWLEQQTKILQICNRVVQNASDQIVPKIEEVTIAHKFLVDFKSQL